MSDVVVGIDLGTTNSEVAGFVDGKVQILGSGQSQMLPSCVGLSSAGELLIGQAARNQMLLYPEQTIRSVKRKMGTNESLTIGDKTFTPQEVSALILRELADWAGRRLKCEVRKAVITVPAYFSDAQRQATREAGALAGLEVVRLINEPTAASLAYGHGEHAAKTVMVYDLGGGTFDVSIVNIQGDITEVLASHGNNHLGGDDFDQLLVDHLLAAFKNEHGIDLRQRDHRAGCARLSWAAEEAKKRLSFEPFTNIREEALVQIDGQPLNLDIEVSRSEYENMIRPLIESTLESVSKALDDAEKSPGDIDVVLLVGGSTRTPLVSETLEQRLGSLPHQDVHPDLCVALGAGVLASRTAGHDVERVLVDVSPYSFGVSYLGDKEGIAYPYCYRPIIQRNTPLPVTRTNVYYTAHDHQTEVEVNIFQGEQFDAMANTPVGNFIITGLKSKVGPNEVLCRMKLDLDGILHVTATEKNTGLSNHVAITDATKTMSEDELTANRDRLMALFATRSMSPGEDADLEDEATIEASTAVGGSASDQEPGPFSLQRSPDERSATDAELDASDQLIVEAKAMMERCRGLMDQLHADDREEAVNLNEEVELAISAGDSKALSTAKDSLGELLFFVEGH